MFSFLRETLMKWFNDLGIYLCMESDDVWNKSFGWTPKDSEGLSKYLDERVLKFFNSIQPNKKTMKNK